MKDFIVIEYSFNAPKTIEIKCDECNSLVYAEQHEMIRRWSDNDRKDPNCYAQHWLMKFKVEEHRTGTAKPRKCGMSSAIVVKHFALDADVPIVVC